MANCENKCRMFPEFGMAACEGCSSVRSDESGDHMGICTICGNKVDWDIIKEDFPELLAQVDYYGPESLTDNEQAVYEGICCSRTCFDKLE